MIPIVENAELDAKLNKLNQAIKHARKNTTYDFKCPQCKKITKKIVSYAKIGVGIKVCLILHLILLYLVHKFSYVITPIAIF